MVQCSHSKEGEVCPISREQCTGTCIYSEIFKNIDLGILVLDIKAKAVIFQNETAKNFFRHAENPRDFGYIHSLFFHKSKTGGEPDTNRDPLSVRLYDRILGYTSYNISTDIVSLFIRDITDKKRLESIAEAVNMMENIGFVFSGIRHEIGNPINSIKMTLSVLRKNLEKYTKENVREYVDRCLSEVQRVEYLLKSLQNFSLFENPKLENVDISGFLEKLISLISEDFSKKGITLDYNVFGDAKWVYADPRMLHQVMLNLLTNAADSFEGRDNPIIQITVMKSSGFVWIRVEDNGCGISKERRKDLFKPFYTSKPHGTGLGLVISRKMLVKMNSTIDINSIESIGTAITLSIPEGQEPGHA